MKVSTGCNVKKYADLEGGEGDKPIEILLSKSLKSSRCFNVIKCIFYLEIILFIGLLGLMALQTYFERPRYPSSSVNEGFESNKFDPDISIITSTTEADSSASDESEEAQNIYRSPLLQEMTNKIQKLVDAIDKLSDSDNSERELLKYREVFKPFLSEDNTNDNSHENYNSRVVIIGSDATTLDSESSQSSGTTQQPGNIEDEPVESDLTKSLPVLVDVIDDPGNVVPILRFDDVFPFFKEELSQSSEDFGIGAKPLFEETSTTPGDNQDALENTGEQEDVSESMIENIPQVPFVDIIPRRSESSSEEHQVSAKNNEDSNTNDGYDSSMTEPEVICNPDEIGVDKLRNLGHFLGFSVPDDWSDCVDADDAFDVLMRPGSTYPIA